MPAASQGKWWQRILRHRAPVLFKKCPVGMLHPLWDDFCYCQVSEPTINWHGGIYDFRRKCEIRPNSEATGVLDAGFEAWWTKYTQAAQEIRTAVGMDTNEKNWSAVRVVALRTWEDGQCNGGEMNFKCNCGCTYCPACEPKCPRCGNDHFRHIGGR